MRFFDVAPLVVLAAALTAMSRAANPRLAERGALGARVVPPSPPATLGKKGTNECPKEYQTCPAYSQCCLEVDECCNSMLRTIQYLADDILLIYPFANRWLLHL